MADEEDQSEKTEDPTHRRLEEALERGDVVKSQEVNTWFVIAASTVAIGLAAPTSIRALSPWLAGLLGHAGDFPVNGGSLRQLWTETGLMVAGAVLLPLGILFLAAAAGNLVQHRLVFSAEQLKPKASKISLFAGFKRLFSRESLINFAKGLVKIALVGGLMVLILRPEFDRLDTLVATDVGALLPLAKTLAMKLMIGVSAVMAVVAGLDYLWQRQRWMNRLRMSAREVKEEYRQAEGDPTIKGKLRALGRERGKRRMMQKVKDASVVITNPTHYAMALHYEPGMKAPVCLAKGVDAVALRIKELARENRVPVVENPPLARALYAEVELDETIPEAHYKAVAAVIGFVMRTRRRAAWKAS